MLSACDESLSLAENPFQGESMFCRKCGSKNDDNAWKCVTCGADMHELRQEKVKPKNYMVFSVLLLLSCIPTALISFFYGLRVNKSFLNGNYDEMETYSQKAKMWVWISFALGIIITLISIPYLLQLYSQINAGMEKQIKDLLRE